MQRITDYTADGSSLIKQLHSRQHYSLQLYVNITVSAIYLTSDNNIMTYHRYSRAYVKVCYKSNLNINLP